jgi:hypothetical protein
MPYYRFGTGFAHIKFSGKAKKNPPAPCCATIALDGKAQRCMAMSTALCDWPVEGGTCDGPMCPEHEHAIGPDRHFCPTHLAMHRAATPELF